MVNSSMKLNLYKPVKGAWLAQGFGGHPEVYAQFGLLGHNGLDLFKGYGVPVRAAHDGYVTYAGVDNSEGWGVVLRTNEPREYKDGEAFFKSIYWHLLPNIPVKVNQQVKTGEILGYMGNTGFVMPKPTPQNPTAGTHLHFALKPQAQGENEWSWANIEQLNGYHGAIDPTPYFAEEGMSAEDYRGYTKILDGLRAKVEVLMRLAGLIK